jgi:hypothetical protein
MDGTRISARRSICPEALIAVRSASPVLVSILTPTLNQNQFINTALSSVARQRHPSIEHIVIDGGSTDGTRDALRRARPSLRWISEPDGGMYDALNRGLAMATGDIIGYLNSDDAYFPWAVDSAVSAFEDRPDVDVIFGDGVRIDEESATQELRLLPPFDRQALAHRGSLIQPAVFWRRGLTDRIGHFDDQLQFVGDLDYWLRAGETGTIAHVEEVLAVDRMHQRALSQARKVEMAAEERSVRASHGADLDTTPGRRTAAWAARREKIWARRLSLRFLTASVRHDSTGPWNRFLTDGDVEVSRLRLIGGQIPRIGYPLLRSSVRSGLAERLLRGG